MYHWCGATTYILLNDRGLFLAQIWYVKPYCLIILYKQRIHVNKRGKTSNE